MNVESSGASESCAIRHDHICDSLELFARRVQPAFQARHEARAQYKAERLAPSVARAVNRIPPLPTVDPVPPVDAYPVLQQKLTGQPPAPDPQGLVASLLGTSQTH
jgi:hypothetical protein